MYILHTVSHLIFTTSNWKQFLLSLGRKWKLWRYAVKLFILALRSSLFSSRDLLQFIFLFQSPWPCSSLPKSPFFRPQDICTYCFLSWTLILFHFAISFRSQLKDSFLDKFSLTSLYQSVPLVMLHRTTLLYGRALSSEYSYTFIRRMKAS